METTTTPGDMFDDPQFMATMHKSHIKYGELALNLAKASPSYLKNPDFLVPNTAPIVGWKPSNLVLAKQYRRASHDVNGVDSDDLYAQQIRRSAPSVSIANANRLNSRFVRGQPRVVYEDGTVGEI